MIGRISLHLPAGMSTFVTGGVFCGCISSSKKNYPSANDQVVHIPQ